MTAKSSGAVGARASNNLLSQSQNVTKKNNVTGPEQQRANSSTKTRKLPQTAKQIEEMKENEALGIRKNSQDKFAEEDFRNGYSTNPDGTNSSSKNKILAASSNAGSINNAGASTVVSSFVKKRSPLSVIRYQFLGLFCSSFDLCNYVGRNLDLAFPAEKWT